MTVTHPTSHRPGIARWGALAAGLALGFALSILAPAWPWVAAALAAAAGWFSRSRTPDLFWLAGGVAGGAVAYLVLALLATALGQPACGSGGS